jgi:hypothetical protein
MSVKIQWSGLAGHFIGSANCCFHLNTRVGRYRISSVGCYHPDRKSDKPTEIGFGRFYETFAFRVDRNGKIKQYSEIDGIGSNSKDEAEKTHMEMIEKYTKMESKP